MLYVYSEYMTEFPSTDLQSVIIKPDKNYKMPLVLVVMVMVLFIALAGYFYFQTLGLRNTISDLNSTIAANDEVVSELEMDVDDHALMYDELVGEVNSYFREVEYDCDATIALCLDELASTQDDLMASDSAQIESSKE